MDFSDDDLIRFEAEGSLPLPEPQGSGFVERDGAPIWFSSFGKGPPVVLLHGGLGNGGNWGYQVPALVLAAQAPESVSKVLYFGCNMDPMGTKEFVFTPVIGRCLARRLPLGKLVVLPGVSHFAPLQRPGLFNQAVLEFLGVGD